MNEKATLPERLRKYRTFYDLMTPHSVAAICDEAAAALEAALPPLRAREEIARALEPFAKIAADYEASDKQSEQHHRDEGRTWTPRSNGHRVSIALGDCRRAREALSLPAGQEWRDISSAPKDGRDLWLWKFGWEKAAVGGWVKKSFTNDGRDLWMLYGGHVVEPTLWLPYYRPAPPVAEPKAGQ